MNQKTLLVAVDGSEESKSALHKAIDFARLLSADILLVHCHRKFPTILGEPYRQESIDEILNETDLIITPYRKILTEAGVPFTERLVEEPAGTMIPKIAAIEACHMIIMGSRGLSRLEGLVIGSVTHRVLHLATCPVLVVR